MLSQITNFFKYGFSLKEEGISEVRKTFGQQFEELIGTISNQGKGYSTTLDIEQKARQKGLHNIILPVDDKIIAQMISIHKSLNKKTNLKEIGNKLEVLEKLVDKYGKEFVLDDSW